MSLISDGKLYTVAGIMPVQVINYSDEYFDDGKGLLGVSSIILTNFVESEKSDFIEYLQDSVDNDYHLNDMLVKREFIVEGEALNFKDDGKDFSYKNMGEYHLNNYKVYVSGGWIFVASINDDRTCMYYAD